MSGDGEGLEGEDKGEGIEGWDGVGDGKEREYWTGLGERVGRCVGTGWGGCVCYAYTIHTSSTVDVLTRGL